MPATPVEITWVAGQIVTAAQLNANVRDAINFLMNPPIFLGRQTVGQSLANTTWTALTLDTEDVDTAGGHSTVTNTSRYTAQYPGWYQWDQTVLHGANATNQRATGFRINGSGSAGPTRGKAQVQATGSFEAAFSSGGLVFFNGVGDYVEPIAWQNSAGSLTTNTADGGCHASATWQSN